MRTAGPAGRCRRIDLRARRVAGLAAGAAPSRSRWASSRAPGVQLGISCGADDRGLRTGVHTGGAMLTVDFDRLGVGAGTKVIDVGCGAGRHAFEAYRRGADVIAFDRDASELRSVETILRAMAETGEAPAAASANAVLGDALSLPYADATFDCVIAS